MIFEDFDPTTATADLVRAIELAVREGEVTEEFIHEQLEVSERSAKKLIEEMLAYEIIETNYSGGYYACVTLEERRQVLHGGEKDTADALPAAEPVPVPATASAVAPLVVHLPAPDQEAMPAPLAVQAGVAPRASASITPRLGNATPAAPIPTMLHATSPVLAAPPLPPVVSASHGVAPRRDVPRCLSGTNGVVAPAFPTEPGRCRLLVDQITYDSAIHPRRAVNQEIVAQYAEDMRAGAAFPPIEVFFDGRAYWIADGVHRWHAAQLAGIPELDVVVHYGDRRAALMHAVGCNLKHGCQTTTADRRLAVELLLRDPELSRMSDRAIGKQCGVDGKTVAKYRTDLICGNSADARLVIRNGKKYTQKLKKSKKASPPSRAPRRPKQLALPPAACGDPLVELEAAARSLQPLVDALVAMTAKEQVSADVDARVGAVAELLHSMAVRLCASRSATADMAA